MEVLKILSSQRYRQLAIVLKMNDLNQTTTDYGIKCSYNMVKQWTWELQPFFFGDYVKHVVQTKQLYKCT